MTSNAEAAHLDLPPQVLQSIHADETAASRALSEAVASRLRESLRQRPIATLLVSGGRSPIPFFHFLSNQALDWSKVVISLADERWVDASSPDSNENLVREHLLKNAAAAARFVPLKNAATEPEAGLAETEQAIAALPRPFDVLILGMGDDGHTASFFPEAPETPAAMDPHSPRLVAVTHPTSASYARVTLTLPALLGTHTIFVSLKGQSKREVVERAFTTQPPLPIAQVMMQSRTPVHVYWSP